MQKGPIERRGIIYKLTPLASWEAKIMANAKCMLTIIVENMVFIDVVMAITLININALIRTKVSVI